MIDLLITQRCDLNHIRFIGGLKLSLGGAKDLVLWHKRLNGKYKVVSSIFWKKNNKKKPP